MTSFQIKLNYRSSDRQTDGRQQVIGRRTVGRPRNRRQTNTLGDRTSLNGWLVYVCPVVGSSSDANMADIDGRRL
jgi:hypothetical protein